MGLNLAGFYSRTHESTWFFIFRQTGQQHFTCTSSKLPLLPWLSQVIPGYYCPVCQSQCVTYSLSHLGFVPSLDVFTFALLAHALLQDIRKEFPYVYFTLGGLKDHKRPLLKREIAGREPDVPYETFLMLL